MVSLFNRSDFEIAMLGSGLNQKMIDNIFAKFKKTIPLWQAKLNESFLPQNLREAYWHLIRNRIEKL